ncbi:MAG: putative LPS assembly protein LptD [Bacteroidota bacterium]
MKIFFSIILLACFPYAVITGQTISDSLRVPVDTAKQVAVPDTTSRSGVDTVVVYSASDSISFSPVTRFMKMYGKGDIGYRDTRLKAERVDINWNTSTLVAYGVKDSTDSTGKKMTGNPVMSDGGEQYTGAQIAYNFKTQRGMIKIAETESSGAFYYGEEIRKMDKDVLFVSDGRYTTCDKPEPHYHFASSKMKVIPHDKIIAEPIYLYIADVPVFALPFGVFPNERGRRSGIIAPSFGEDTRLGRYLSGGGYYWAMSDYTDLTTRADWYTKGGWVFHGVFNYALRYKFDGSLSANWTNEHTGLQSDPGYLTQRDYNLSITHHQNFNPTTRLDIDFSFASSSYYQNTTTNLSDYLRQNIVSNATLSKSWEGTPNSATINLYRDQDLRNGNIRMRLPSLSFSHSQSYPFRRRKSASDHFAWYELIGVNYSGQFSSEYDKTSRNDSARTFDETTRYGASHDVSISASPKAGYITISPQISYHERWYPENIDKEFDTADSTIKTRVNKGFKAVRTFSTGLSASTKLYGIFPIRVFGLQGFRHTLTPSLSYNYTPDFSKSFWGYYGQYYDAKAGTTVRYDRYEQSLYGGASAGEQQNIGLSISNNFEAKAEQTDTTKEAEKYQLLYLGANISYNLAADSLRLSDLNLNYRTDFGGMINVGGNATYTFYQTDTTGGRYPHRINRFLVSDGQGLARLNRFSFNISTSLSGGKRIPSASSRSAITTAVDTTTRSGKTGLKSPQEKEPVFSIPWNISLTWDYSIDRSNPYSLIRSSNIQGNINLELTKNWRVTMSGSYDLISKQVAAVTVNVYRDLHCWEMNFNWYPTGYFRGFRFELRVKAPELRDLKVTKQGGVYTRGY